MTRRMGGEQRFGSDLSASQREPCPSRCLIGEQPRRHPDRVARASVFRAAKQMVHVKKYAGSGVLSHLFAQGANAAEMLLFDGAFRQKVRAGLPASHQDLVDLTPPRASDFEVVYGIIGRPMGTKSLAEVLPFFSRVTLRRVAQRLQGVGFKVSVAWIPNR
jgi:uncharacterized protein (TIGR04141 family)